VGPLLAFALIAGDPDFDWAEVPSSAPAPEVSPAPAPPPSALRQPERPNPVGAAPSGELDALVDRPLAKSFRLSAEVTIGISPSSMGEIGLGAELDWYPFQFVRFHATVSGAYVPYQQYLGVFESRGAARLLFGFDGVLPFTWGELFLGIDSGVSNSNVEANSYYGCPYCGGGGYGDALWTWQPAMRLRGGFDLTVMRPVVVGFDVAYTQFPARMYFFGDVHFVEFHGRFGLAF
jgi:hypothetical protein